MEVVLIDFGIATFMSDLASVNPITGTAGYCAPETLKKGKYSDKSDVFSLGTIIYQMLAGEKLFKGKEMREILVKNQNVSAVSILECNHNLRCSR